MNKEIKNKELTPTYEAFEKSLKEKGIEYYTISIDNTKFYISEIPRITLKKVSHLLTAKPINAFEIILKDIFLGGDKNVFTDTDIFLSAMQVIMDTVTPFELFVTKDDKKHTFKCLIKDEDKKLASFELKQMDIATLSAVYAMQDRGDVFGAGEYIFDKCWLNGDPEVKTDNRLFITALGVIEHMFNIKTANIKKN